MELVVIKFSFIFRAFKKISKEKKDLLRVESFFRIVFKILNVPYLCDSVPYLCDYEVTACPG